jgi:hypothetical protein
MNSCSVPNNQHHTEFACKIASSICFRLCSTPPVKPIENQASPGEMPASWGASSDNSLEVDAPEQDMSVSKTPRLIAKFVACISHC